MNYMKQVAEMLGVQLYQKFRISGPYFSALPCWFRFTDRKFEYYDNNLGGWQDGDLDTLCDLLNGMDEVIKPYEVADIGINSAVVEKHILTGHERKWLSNIIEPFRKDVIGIAKLSVEDTISLFINTRCNSTDLPGIKKEDTFSGMKNGKMYSIEELSL